VIVEREKQLWKQDWPILLTLKGMQIDDNAEHCENA
jgi:hypothetical protein